MITRYESEVEDITFETLAEKLERLRREGGGTGGGTGGGGTGSGSTPRAGVFNQPTAMPTTLQGRAQQARATLANPLVPEGGQPAGNGGEVGPAGRTFDQITGTEYRSDAERQWYLARLGQGGAAVKAASGGSPSTGGASSTAAKAPPPPPRDSASDLANRGAVKVSSTPVLEGRQYKRVNEVVEAPGGGWYIVDPEGNVLSGPYRTQTEANAANVYTNVGPAITSNPYARIGEMALMGPNRPRVAPGAGLSTTVGLDNIIGATAQRGEQTGDFLGATQAFKGIAGGPVDITRGLIPDYGGMRNVSDAAGNAVGGYTGRVTNDQGQEVAIGMSGVNPYNSSQFQQAAAPYLSASQINRIDPADYNEVVLKLLALRDQGVIQQADTDLTKGNQAKNWAALGMDPFDIDVLPEPMARGGSIFTGMPGMGGMFGRTPPAADPEGAGVWFGEGTFTAPPPPVGTRLTPHGGGPEGEGGQWYGDEFFPDGSDGTANSNWASKDLGFGLQSTYGLMADGSWNFMGPKGNLFQDLNRNGIPDFYEELGLDYDDDKPQPENDIWRGLMGDSPSWWEGAYPYLPDRSPPRLSPPVRIQPIGRPRRPRRMAGGGNIVTGNEPMVVMGQQTGNAYATIGEPNALTGGHPTREVLNVTPLEPSVPVQAGPPAPSAFAILMEQLFDSKSKGRKPQYQPVA